ncbi:MAG: EAL domain-containing protein [Lachnospiraceae bacterium]|nr:EAL domain-containing protein [Lachnospiraceae bacterium]
MNEYLLAISSIVGRIGFQTAAAAICVSVLLFYLMRNRPEKTENKLFMLLVLNVLLCSLCDITGLSLIPFVMESEGAFAVRKTMQYVYFMIHVSLAPILWQYVAFHTGMNYRIGRFAKCVISVPFFVMQLMTLINPFTGWVCYFDEDRAYARGVGLNVIFGASILYYVISIGVILFFWNFMNKKSRYVIVYFFAVTTIGLVVQMVFLGVNTELFSESLGLLGLMMTIENEDNLRDPHTGIYNYKAFENDLRLFMKVRQSFCVIILKVQNPMTFIRLIGPGNIEALTAMTVDYLATVVQRRNIYYLGMGTFAIINDNNDKRMNLEISNTFKERFDKSWHFMDRDARFAAAIYCAEIPKEIRTAKEIMMLAHSPAPSGGKDTTVVSGSSLQFLLRQSQVESAIISGLKKKSFEVYYQPIYRASDLSICAGEALVRLHDEAIGEIYPDEFITITERTGMIFELGDFVLEEVCKFLNSGIPTEMGLDTLNINLSISQCMQTGYAGRIIDIVSKYNIAPSRITFEIKESAASTDFNTLRRFVTALREKDFNIAVDDYGIGFSNIHFLTNLDVETVKIDRTVFWEAEQSDDGRIIMDSYIAMLKKLNRQIFITGVETKSQIDLAAEFEVNYLQGYYFSNPVSQNEFIGILKATQLARVEEQKALAASEAMSTFLANMSHEIRTPINAVLGMDEMILRESGDESIRGYAKNIASAGRTLLSLINDILDFSKIESGSIELSDAPYELSSMLSDVINMIQLKAAGKGLDLKVEVNPATPEQLSGDEIRIRQILLNILNNAVKYTDKGSITLNVRFEKLTKGAINLILSVKDTGIGIKEEDIGKLFDKFKRLDIDRNKTVEGSGLGLAITNQLIKQMDGDIKVESIYGKGTTFIVTIPQKLTSDATIGLFTGEPARKDDSEVRHREVFRAPEARILVVDDTPMNLVVVKELLKETRIHIDEALSGTECLKKLEKNSYDLLLLDYRMPEMDGIETLKRIKEKGLSTFPVIALTANAISGARERFLKEGFDDYITKPIDSERLEKLLMMYLPGDKIERIEPDGEAVPDKQAAEGIPDGQTMVLFQPQSGNDNLQDSWHVGKDGWVLTDEGGVFDSGSWQNVEGAGPEAETDSICSRMDLSLKEEYDRDSERLVLGERQTPDTGGEEELLIDTTAGIKNCGSEESYRKVLQVFCDEIEKRVDTIKNALDRGDIERYTVEVHSIKSSARVIGASKLSKLAEELENAGNDGDREKINRKTDELLSLYESCEHPEYLKRGDNKGGDPENRSIPKKLMTDELWEDALKTLKEFSENMDYDNAALIIESVKEYDLDGHMREVIGKLGVFADELHWEEALELIDAEIKAVN